MLLTSGAVAPAQPTGPIVAEVFNGATTTFQNFSDTSPITVSLATINNAFWRVKIYDVATIAQNGVPTRNIPHVTINGTVGTNALLEVLIGDGDAGFP